MGRPKKLFVVGFDGADKQAFVDGINSGSLQNFAEIMKKGGIATLKSPLPPTTSVSMSSILTGQEPGKHGVFSFENDPADGGGYVNYGSIQGDTIFDHLDRHGKKIIPVNVPMTSPLPENIDFGVAGFPSDSSEFAEPYPVREKLKQEDYRVEPIEFSEGREEFVEDVFELAEKRFEVSRELVEEEWDVFFLMFTGDARLQHFIEDENTIKQFYEQADEYVGELLEKIEEDVEVLVVSDHGFHRVENVFDLGAWMEEEGYLENEKSDTSKLYGQLDFDPEGSTAYPGGAYLGNIFAEEDVRQEIVEKLSRIETGDGKVFRDVFLAEQLYGESDGPDIIPVPRRKINYVAGYSDKILDDNPVEKKSPDREGVIITSIKGINLEDSRSIDVLPTILDFLEIREEGFDGRSLIDR